MGLSSKADPSDLYLSLLHHPLLTMYAQTHFHSQPMSSSSKHMPLHLPKLSRVELQVGLATIQDNTNQLNTLLDRFDKALNKLQDRSSKIDAEMIAVRNKLLERSAALRKGKLARSDQENASPSTRETHAKRSGKESSGRRKHERQSSSPRKPMGVPDGLTVSTYNHNLVGPLELEGCMSPKLETFFKGPAILALLVNEKGSSVSQVPRERPIVMPPMAH